jgi:hypothetical protein
MRDSPKGDGIIVLHRDFKVIARLQMKLLAHWDRQYDLALL